MAQGQPQKAAEVLEALVKAERARPEEQGKRFENVVGDAETLLTELSVELNAPKLRQDLAPAPSAMPAAGRQGSRAALTKDIVEQLRKQLEQGKGGEGPEQRARRSAREAGARRRPGARSGQAPASARAREPQARRYPGRAP